MPTKVHIVKVMVFPVAMYGCKSRTINKAACWRIDAFELWYWRRLLDCKEINPVNAKGKQSWIFIGRTEGEAPILWPPDVKNWLIGKDPDAGKDWRQEEKGTTEAEVVGWHHLLDGHEFEQAPGAGDQQGNLECWTDSLIWLLGASPVLFISELCSIPDLELSIWWPTTHRIINGLNQIYMPGLCQRSHPILLLHSIPNLGILFYLQRLDICLYSWSSFITYTLYILFPPMQIFILTFPRNILPCGSDSKETACNGTDPGSVSGMGRSPGGGHGYPLQYSCLENPHGQRSLAG